jgi:hypothetical protein
MDHALMPHVIDDTEISGASCVLAQLFHDSESDHDTAAAMRSENASIRALTFISSRLSIELEITDGLLIGQITPPRPGALEMHTKAGATISWVDDIGFFVADSVPPSPFRLRFFTTDGIDVITGWITL